MFSGGWCFLLLAAFYGILDWGRCQKWAFPLIVIGMNSIAAYCLAHLIHDFTVTTFKTHFGQDIYSIAGANYAPLVEGMAVLTVYWLILYWMYCRRLFLRI